MPPSNGSIRRAAGDPRLAAGILALLFSSCTPKIQAYSVTPRRVCAGDSVTLAWQASGDVTLVTDPSVAVPAKLANSGSLRLAVQDTTSFMIVARRGSRADSARQDVAVLSPKNEKILAFRMQPLGDTALTSTETPPAGQWDSILVIESVRALDGRALHVEHAGQTAALAADSTPSAALRGLPVQGAWTITTPLLDDERIDDPQHRWPAHLRVGLRLACTH
jgi:hypothetical protein